MSILDTTPAGVQAAILRTIAKAKHPRLVKGSLASRHNMTVANLEVILNHHGYPDAQRMLAAAHSLDMGDDSFERPAPARVVPTSTAPPNRVIPGSPSTTVSTPPTRPDDLTALLDAAKGHPSRAVQAAAGRAINAVDRLKTLLAEEKKKAAERARVAAEQAAAREEVQRLQQQLEEARAKLRPEKKPRRPQSEKAREDSIRNLARGRKSLEESNARIAAVLKRHDVTAKDIRAWAAEHDIECPARGRLPLRVVDEYDARMTPAAAS